MKFTTVVPIKTRTFSAQNRQWEWQAPAWLREMQSSGFGCSAIHTLQIEERGRFAKFHLLVCEAMNPLPPLPANISIALGAAAGSVIWLLATAKSLLPRFEFTKISGLARLTATRILRTRSCR